MAFGVFLFQGLQPLAICLCLYEAYVYADKQTNYQLLYFVVHHPENKAINSRFLAFPNISDRRVWYRQYQ